MTGKSKEWIGVPLCNVRVPRLTFPPRASRRTGFSSCWQRDSEIHLSYQAVGDQALPLRSDLQSSTPSKLCIRQRMKSHARNLFRLTIKYARPSENPSINHITGSWFCTCTRLSSLQLALTHQPKPLMVYHKSRLICSWVVSIQNLEAVALLHHQPIHQDAMTTPRHTLRTHSRRKLVHFGVCVCPKELDWELGRSRGCSIPIRKQDTALVVAYPCWMWGPS